MTTANKEILKRLDEMRNDILTEMETIKKFIPQTDIVTNQRYCEIRTESGMPLKPRGLREWFTKGCPRRDKHHVSISEVNKWALENFKPKTKEL